MSTRSEKTRQSHGPINAKLKTVMSNSFGFDGSNSTLVFHRISGSS